VTFAKSLCDLCGKKYQDLCGKVIINHEEHKENHKEALSFKRAILCGEKYQDLCVLCEKIFVPFVVKSIKTFVVKL